MHNLDIITSSNTLTMSTREISNLLNRPHSDVKRSAERRLGVAYCNSVSHEFTHRNNKYTEYILDSNCASTLMSQLSTKSRAINSLEETALSTIEQLLNVELSRQFSVGKYRVDGYDIKNKIAYEIDEQHHGATSKKDQVRQLEIEKILSCTFVRINV